MRKVGQSSSSRSERNVPFLAAACSVQVRTLRAAVSHLIMAADLGSPARIMLNAVWDILYSSS